ncbi:MAG: DUF1926 domain-containing protein [Ignavibacteriae bacterium]|nr:DUF1926 domain-containing protein [Ignavibacteriota bacterium]
MKKIKLVLGIHNHQPIGNFDSVFEHAFAKSYEPFLDLLERYPRIKLSQHYTGVLLEWLLQNRPKFIQKLQKLVASGQVDMMGGAYYEAILSIIPDEDKVGQLVKLSNAIKKHFGKPPVGMWLAERVWEQHLAKSIAEAGLRYTVVDDTHFKYAGFSEEELLGYYMTEEQGKTIAVFPISKRLRYTIPFQPVKHTIDYLREIATEDGDRVAVYADDGEKFGVWPDTYDHVFTRGWLNEFFKALSDNLDWIQVVHFKDVLKSIPPAGQTYLPNASYAEMLHWALPPHHFALYEEFEHVLQQQGIRDKYESFFKGGFWRNFLAKYPEVNQMHKKMLHVSERARVIEQSKKSNGKAALDRIRSHIYASQCNDPYWHGVFGGLYLPVLRHPIYKNLIAAENELDKLEKNNAVRVITYDFDRDGHDDVVVESPTLNCYFKPNVGGAIIELDFKPACLNVLDIVSRREEGYHTKLKHAVAGHTPSGGVASIHDVVKSKEPGLEQYLSYDWYRHCTLVDHFFSAETTLDDVWRCAYKEEGDFVDQPYNVKARKKGANAVIELSRHGRIRRQGKEYRISVQKHITIDSKKNLLEIDYTLRNEEREPLQLWFGVEFNVGLQAGNTPDRYYYLDNGGIENAVLRSKGELRDLNALGLRDEWMGVDVRIEMLKPATIWRFPIEVISQSEGGFERIFQSSVVIPHWKFTLEKEWHVKLFHRFKSVKR